MSLTNPNTPVSQQDLKDLYEHKLLPYLGGSFGLVATGIDSANLYSTTERVVGQWIDRKPLYQKTIYLGNFPNSTRVDVNHGIANIDQIVSIEGFLKYSDENFYPLTHFNYDGSKNYLSGIWSTKTQIKLVTNWNASKYDGYAILKYTKTTDSAVESYGTDTTYSTDEHVVGSWVDGRPVYQKTIYNTSLGSIPNSAWTNYATIPNCKCIIDSVFMRALADGTPSGVFNDIAASVGTSNNIRVISRTTTLTLDDSKSYLTIRYTKTS